MLLHLWHVHVSINKTTGAPAVPQECLDTAFQDCFQFRSERLSFIIAEKICCNTRRIYCCLHATGIIFIIFGVQHLSCFICTSSDGDGDPLMNHEDGILVIITLVPVTSVRNVDLPTASKRSQVGICHCINCGHENFKTLFYHM